MSGSIAVHVDMTAPGRGIVLVVGPHGFQQSPQGLLGKTRAAWYLEDYYGDLGRDGITPRTDYLDTTASTLREAVERWLRHLGIDPEAEHVHIEKPEREY
jgi:hypothetical protein